MGPPSATNAKPLSGVEVVDFSQTLPGPYCTQLLADLGANVTKIERPDGGDYLRELMPQVFNQFNRGKRSVALDLKDAADQELAWTLTQSADILVEGFRPGVMDRLGLDARTVREGNPRLIYCSISGWGQNGPWRESPGHDLNYLGATGALLDPIENSAKPPGLLIADLASGALAANAILAGLIGRETSGEGATIDLAMADVTMSWALPSHIAKLSGEIADSSPAHGIFETSDGKLVTLGAIEDRFWSSFCDIADDPRLMDGRFDTHEQRRNYYGELRDLLRDVFAQRTADEWLGMSSDADVPIYPVHSFTEALGESQFVARGVIARQNGGLQIAFPARWNGSLMSAGSESPSLGAHNDELGLT